MKSDTLPVIPCTPAPRRRVLLLLLKHRCVYLIEAKFGVTYEIYKRHVLGCSLAMVHKLDFEELVMDESLKSPSDLSLSILVVDDDELNQRMMRLLLKREGHSVECAANGQEAFDAVMKGSYDMVLMDLQMPVMDGVEASRRIRAWENGLKHTYIVALTASYLPERGAELFQAGIDNYIAKPFDVDHLRNILENGRENRKLRNSQKEAGSQPSADRLMIVLDPQLGIQRVGGDIEIYKEFLRDFINDLPGKLDALQTSAQNNDMDGLGRAAHNLKGVSGNLGALQLSEQSQRLEKEVSEGYTDKVENLLNEIMTVSDGLKKNISEYINIKS